MRVVLLGAGASKAYAESPTGQRMPLTRDFFKTFRSLEGNDHPWIIAEGLITYITGVMGLSPDEFLDSDIDIEELHSQIQDTVIRSVKEGDVLGQINSFRAFNELLFLFAFVMNNIQNGPISIPHRKLAKLLSPTDVVLTFNWDTLMDRALAIEKEWLIDTGYGLIPKAIFSDDWRNPSPGHNTSFPCLLKLHGSTNWLTSYTIHEQGKITLTQASTPDTVYFFEYSTKPYSTYAGRYMPGYQPFSYGYYPPNILNDPGKPVPEGHVLIRGRLKLPWRPDGPAGDEGLVSMPLIIPPVKDKTYDLFGDLFSHLWHAAERALVTADRIVIIGYSFPRTDHRSNRLFKDAFRQRKSLPRVVIINPHPEYLYDKFRLEFGIPDDKLIINADYFSAEFPLEEALSEE